LRNIWRALPRLALPAAVGLGLAYVVTGFAPRPQGALRPPEELRAKGLAMAEESPVRAILERNVLRLESPPFAPPDIPLPPPAEPAPEAAALNRPPAPEGASNATAPAGAANAANAPGQPGTDGQSAAFAPLEPLLLPMADKNRKRHALSGGASVLGFVAAPQNVPPGLEGFRLVAVMAGARPAAMFLVDGVPLTLHPGGQAKGWTLEAVERGRVLLRKNGQVRALALNGAAGAASPTPGGP
jgi:hypothetical protein